MIKRIIEFKNSKLTKKLVLRLFIIFSFTILYIVLISSNSIKKLESERLNDISQLFIESYSKESNIIIDNAYKTADFLSLQIENLEGLDLENIENIVEPALKSYDDFKGIFIILKNDDEIVSPYWFRDNNEIKTELVEDADSPKYWSVIENDERGLVKPQLYTVDGKEILLTTLEVPIKKNGEVIGIVGIDLTLEFFQTLSNKLKTVENMEIAIVSYEGMIIAHSNPENLGKSLYDFSDDYINLSINEVIDKKINSEVDRYILHTEFNMGNTDQMWHLIVTVPNRLMNTIAHTTSIHIAIIAVLSLLIIIIFSAMTINRTLRPIKEVCDVMDSAYKGDLSARTFIHTGDEIESIGKGLNDLLKSLEKNRKKLESEVAANHELNIELEELMKDNDRIYFDTIKSLVRTIEAKDLYTGGHCDRVTNYSNMIGAEIGLTRKEMSALNYGATLHDIGKIGIHEDILCKVGKLTNEEFEQIKEHPLKGFEIIKDINFLKDSNSIILQHHERYDGKGYPNGLAGEDIDLQSRIVSVADAFDAMTSSRSYRKALSKVDAIKELIKNRGTQFDPFIVDCFIKVIINYEEEQIIA